MSVEQKSIDRTGIVGESSEEGGTVVGQSESAVIKLGYFLI